MNKTQKLVIVLLASLIGMLLCGGVASADMGNCCCPSQIEGEQCFCDQKFDFMGYSAEYMCIYYGGIWMGEGGCDRGGANEPCDQYCTEGGKCVPEKSTIVLLATGLFCMAGYFRIGRRKI